MCGSREAPRNGRHAISRVLQTPWFRGTSSIIVVDSAGDSSIHRIAAAGRPHWVRSSRAAVRRSPGCSQATVRRGCRGCWPPRRSSARPRSTRCLQRFGGSESAFEVVVTALQQPIRVHPTIDATMSWFHAALSDAVERSPVIVDGMVVDALAPVGTVRSASFAVLLCWRALQRACRRRTGGGGRGSDPRRPGGEPAPRLVTPVIMIAAWRR